MSSRCILANGGHAWRCQKRHATRSRWSLAGLTGFHNLAVVFGYLFESLGCLLRVTKRCVYGHIRRRLSLFGIFFIHIYERFTLCWKIHPERNPLLRFTFVVRLCCLVPSRDDRFPGGTIRRLVGLQDFYAATRGSRVEGDWEEEHGEGERAGCHENSGACHDMVSIIGCLRPRIVTGSAEMMYHPIHLATITYAIKY